MCRWRRRPPRCASRRWSGRVAKGRHDELDLRRGDGASRREDVRGRERPGVHLHPERQPRDPHLSARRRHDILLRWLEQLDENGLLRRHIVHCSLLRCHGSPNPGNRRRKNDDIRLQCLQFSYQRNRYRSCRYEHHRTWARRGLYLERRPPVHPLTHSRHQLLRKIPVNPRHNQPNDFRLLRGGKGMPLRHIPPFRHATATTGGGRMHRLENRVPAHRRLPAVLYGKICGKFLPHEIGRMALDRRQSHTMDVGDVRRRQFEPTAECRPPQSFKRLVDCHPRSLRMRIADLDRSCSSRIESGAQSPLASSGESGGKIGSGKNLHPARWNRSAATSKAASVVRKVSARQ